MKIATLFAALMLLAGCSTTTSDSRPPMLRASIPGRADAGTDSTLFAVEFTSTGGESIVEYKLAGGPPARRIREGVRGVVSIAVDRAGTLYALEESTVHDFRHYRLVEYARGATQPVRTIQRGRWQPVVMAFNNDGDLYVLDRNSKVWQFKPGAIDPYYVLVDGLDVPTAMTIGADGTLFVADGLSTGSVSNKGAVTVYAGGRRLIATIQENVLSPFGVALDGRGTLYVSDPIGTAPPGGLPTIAQYDAGNDDFLRSVTVTQSTYAVLNRGLGADSLGNIYASYGGCIASSRAKRCAAGVNVYPPSATKPSRILLPPKGAAFGSIAFGQGGNMYLVVCATQPPACEVRAYPRDGKPWHTPFRVPNTTIGPIAPAP
jgi:hypothetical protein